MVLVATDKYTQSEEMANEAGKLKHLRLALYIKETSISDLQDPIKVRSAFPSASRWQGTNESVQLYRYTAGHLYRQFSIPSCT